MTIAEIIHINRALEELNKQSGKLSAKSKWNLCLNLKRGAEVAKAYEEHRIEAFKKHAEDGSNEIKPTDAGWAGYKKDVEEMLSVESDAKILHFDFNDIVRDDVEISAVTILQLEGILDNKPE